MPVKFNDLVSVAKLATLALALVAIVGSFGCTNSDPVLSSADVVFRIDLSENTTRYEIGIFNITTVEFQPLSADAQTVTGGDPIVPISASESPVVAFDNLEDIETRITLAPGIYRLDRLNLQNGQFVDNDFAGDGSTCQTQNVYFFGNVTLENLATIEVQAGSSAIILNFDIAAFMAAIETAADPALGCVPSSDALEALAPTFLTVS